MPSSQLGEYNLHGDGRIVNGLSADDHSMYIDQVTADWELAVKLVQAWNDSLDPDDDGEGYQRFDDLMYGGLPEEPDPASLRSSFVLINRLYQTYGWALDDEEQAVVNDAIDASINLLGARVGLKLADIPGTDPPF